MPRCTYCKEFILHAKNLSNHQSKSKRCQALRAEYRAQISTSFNTASPTQNNPPVYSEDHDSFPRSSYPDFESETLVDHASDSTYGNSGDNDAIPPSTSEEPTSQDTEPLVWEEHCPQEHRAGAAIGHSKTIFETYRDDQILQGAEILGPFESDAEWELAKWLIKNVGHNQADEFLRLPIVS